MVTPLEFSEGASPEPLDLSILIPVYNEVGNVVELHAELDATLSDLGLAYELIFVDDGSTDGTASRLRAIQDADPEHVRVASLRHNGGQTAALSAALDLSRGLILIPMDGDRQNDPADIPRLLSNSMKGSTLFRAGGSSGKTPSSPGRSRRRSPIA